MYLGLGIRDRTCPSCLLYLIHHFFPQKRKRRAGWRAPLPQELDICPRASAQLINSDDVLGEEKEESLWIAKLLKHFLHQNG